MGIDSPKVLNTVLVNSTYFQQTFPAIIYLTDVVILAFVQPAPRKQVEPAQKDTFNKDNLMPKYSFSI